MKGVRRKSRGPRFQRRLNPLNWLLRHAQMSLSSLGRLAQNPLGTGMTAAVIGIAIALPAGLYLLVDNMRTLTGSWDGGSSISLFLQQTLSDAQASQVRDVIARRDDVAEAQLISRQEALAEFRLRSGFGEALDLLENNPLPAVILVKPARAASAPDDTGRLADTLASYREIDMVRVDLQWVRRLEAISRTLERGILILAGMLAAAVLLIVGNTIRLEIQHRQPEIEVIKLVGGTDGFIRRPFLYEGLWYGLLGGLIALLLVMTGLALMQGPVQRLAGLYQSGFSLEMFQSGVLTTILLGSPLLGLAGAWLAVGRHLARIQPE